MPPVKDRFDSFLRERPALNYAIRSVAQPRTFQLYNVGAAKTGTTSVAGLFVNFRRGHEPTIYEAAARIEARWQGAVSEDELLRWLRRRDRALWLECESCQTMAWFSDLLVRTYPEARFMLTVRDCYSWLRSIVDHHLNKPPRSEAQVRLRELFYGTPPGDEASSALREAGLHAIDGYLTYWAKHNAFVLEHVPAERLLVLPTKRISASKKAVARHVGVAPEALSDERSHLNPAVRKRRLIDEVEHDALAQKIERYCGPTITQLQARPELDGYDLVGL